MLNLFNHKKTDAGKKSASGNKKRKQVKAGEFLSINDVRTRGHKSLIVSANKKERKKETFKHLPITHSPTTRRLKNISLIENPEGVDEQSYILPKVQKSRLSDDVLGKKHPNTKIKNSIDKSIVRNVKKKSKR